MIHVRFAVYLAVSLLIGMITREYARSLVASRLNDPTPRLWGRLTLNPKSWFEPFGSGMLPALILLLWAAGSTFLPPPVAYAKPAPVDPSYFRNRTRDTVLTALAGPSANLASAAVAGMILRVGAGGQIQLATIAFLLTSLSLMIFHLVRSPDSTALGSWLWRCRRERPRSIATQTNTSLLSSS